MIEMAGKTSKSQLKEGRICIVLTVGLRKGSFRGAGGVTRGSIQGGNARKKGNRRAGKDKEGCWTENVPARREKNRPART